ncbi:DUF421 domain-containing protein [Dyella acidiphila]|uniref:DUF421 domain-containing protein n=1 Tax=Dyella acidiphila TaxID=2775866 RepID=A0ABR9GBS7_9GAMM|nr:YetF domain-containing protein [Dyella acidiphila]MBE1161518.1 DUF421 domain-containing protein [Dyella acidiphila]
MSTLALTEPWWHYAVRGVFTYSGLLLFMRFNGKRAFGEMSAFDVIVLVLVGGALRSAIVGDDKSVTAPFIGVAFILLTDRCLAWCCARSAKLNRWVEGMPTILVTAGKRHHDALRQENVPEAAFERALHQHGWEDEKDVAIGRLEPNGKITFVRSPSRPRS